MRAAVALLDFLFNFLRIKSVSSSLHSIVIESDSDTLHRDDSRLLEHCADEEVETI